MTPRISTALIAAVLAFAPLAVLANGASSVPKPAPRAKAVEKADKQSKPISASDRVWQRTMDRPCDSAACRPLRLPWSPVAPGA